MKLFSTLLLVISLLFNLNAQKLITEKLISAFEEVEMVEYLAPGFFAVACFNYTACGSSSVTFVKSGKVISRHSFAESFVKEIKVRGDSIAITTLYFPADRGTVRGAKVSYFDENGQNLSTIQTEINNKNWEKIEDLVAVDAGEAVLIADMTGQLHYNFEGSDEVYPIVHPLPLTPSKPLFLLEAPEYQSSFDRKYYITVFQDLMLVGTMSDYFNEELRVLELADIQYVKYTGYNQIIVMHGNQISIFNLYLQEIQSYHLLTNAQSWSALGLYIYGINDLGNSSSDPNIKMLEVTRIKTSDFSEISKDTIYHSLINYETLGYNDSIFIMGQSPDGKQVVWDQYDLNSNPSGYIIRADIGMTIELKNPMIKYINHSYSLQSDAIVSITNYGPQIIENVLFIIIQKDNFGVVT